MLGLSLPSGGQNMRWILVLLSLISMTTNAESLRQRVDSALMATRTCSFPELSSVNIELRESHSEEYLFETDIVRSSLWMSGRPRIYLLYLSSRFDASTLSAQALEAILAHELQHVLDYERWSLVRLAFFYARYSWNADYRHNYERETDRRVLARGYADGLIEYREWLYAGLSPEQVVRKRRDYLSPEEIRAWPQ